MKSGAQEKVPIDEKVFEKIAQKIHILVLEVLEKRIDCTNQARGFESIFVHFCDRKLNNNQKNCERFFKMECLSNFLNIFSRTTITVLAKRG